MLAQVLGALEKLRDVALHVYGIDIITSHANGQAKSSDSTSQQLVTCNIAPRRDIAILSMSTPEIKAYADLAHANHLHYARQNNYSAYVYKSVNALAQSIEADEVSLVSHQS